MLTPQQKLHVLLKRFRWVLEDTVWDQKLIEANRMEALPVVDLYRYLRGRAKPALSVLRSVVAGVQVVKNPVYAPGAHTTIQKLQWYGKRYPDVFHVLVADEKEREAAEIVSSDTKMMQYLKSQFDSDSTLLEHLLWLQHAQHSRRKSWKYLSEHSKSAIA
jgi:hypothetical protein